MKLFEFMGEDRPPTIIIAPAGKPTIVTRTRTVDHRTSSAKFKVAYEPDGIGFSVEIV